ncbi:c-type cytochrome biogenesis protein CcmI [Sulfurimicrobium lacus]|uniref:C-type cytochrome biogenesis protein CcmI n=1 Tax=Sulfurimicrobium lacus TaxID=2715678 RepID=A0A6F8VCM1_9PROT|nr:c-type cytochrome biogenesis protein CcmI [Sulfurimicrobium lacus]BCB27080.1 c-type cytochrome biogenesis protein CcmI [Sulfurimicrobium lacus]
MTNFWTISLFWIFFLVFIAVALAFVLPPLLRRNVAVARVDRKALNVAIYHDQMDELKADLDSGELDASQYEDARREIEKRLSEDVPAETGPAPSSPSARWPGYVVAGALPVLAIALYAYLGNPSALLTSSEAAAPEMQQGQHEVAPMIATLEAKLKKNPDDAAGWYMLARSYGATGRFADAAQAFSKIAELVPDNSSVLADYADALAMAQGGNLQGKPLDLINRALKLNEQDEKALNLAGTAAYQEKKFALAAEYWRRLLKVIPPDSDASREVASAIAEAEKASGGAPALDNLSSFDGKNSSEENVSKPLTSSSVSVSGTVSISKELAGNLDPADTVFIFAQLPQGPKMPLAGVKITVKQLPYHFTLDDSVAMMPNNKLSDHPEVIINARVSKSGQPMAQSGDLQGKVGPVKLGQKDVKITIDSRVP